jgi:uncharacterized repeat protein (TIGR03943 family)
MLKPFQFLRSFTQRVLSAEDDLGNGPVNAATDDPVLDIWSYAEPAGEEPDPLKRNVLQWRRLISSVRDPLETFPGQSVSVTGFVQRMPANSSDQFVIARPIIRCCLADTVPLGLVVHTPEAAAFDDDIWLHVLGRFGIQLIQDRPTLVVFPNRVKRIAVPKKLYINGVF